MDIRSTPIEGVFEIIPKVFPDNRGWFLELHKDPLFAKVCPSTKFVQENLSFSKKGVVRGLHLHLPPAQQAKLVTVINGRVLDVIVDLRKGSHNFGKVYKLVLDSKKHNMLFIPKGFAHGFLALEDSIFLYRCSSTYNPDYERGIRWNDPQLKIDWGIEKPILSTKDEKLPTFKELLVQGIISSN